MAASPYSAKLDSALDRALQGASLTAYWVLASRVSEMEVKVYSNQKAVALYVNGEKAGEQTGEHVFSFRVPLTGEIEVRAVAGDCTDTASFRHVDTPNPSYKLVKTKSKSANWV